MCGRRQPLNNTGHGDTLAASTRALRLLCCHAACYTDSDTRDDREDVSLYSGGEVVIASCWCLCVCDSV